MISDIPQVLYSLLEKQRVGNSLSADAQKLIETLRKEFDNDIFKHFFYEYNTLIGLGLASTDIKQYFDEWSADAVAITSEGAELTFVNFRHVALFGYQHSEILGQSAYNLIVDDMRSTIKGKLEFRKRGISDSYEVKMIKKNREVIDVRITGYPIYDRNDQYIGSIATLRDISKEKMMDEKLRVTNEELEAKVQKRTRELTISNYQMVNEIKERKLAEIAVKNSEKRFRDLFYSSPEGVFVEDFEGNILDLNEAAAKLHGYTRDEMIGMNVKQFTPGDDLSNFEQRQRQLTIGETESFEVWIKHREGHLIPIAVRSAVIEYNDKPVLLLHARDITERMKYQETLQQMNLSLEEKVRQRTEELETLNSQLHKEVSFRKGAEIAIEQQKDFLRMLIDMNPNMIFVKDKDGKLVLVNEAFAKFHNSTTADMVGKNVEAFMNKESVANLNTVKGYQGSDAAVINDKKTMSFNGIKLFYQSDRNDSIFIQLIKTPIQSLTDNTTNILGIMTDVTEIKTAEEKLKQSEQLYRQIARNVPNSAIMIFDKNLRYVLAEGSLIGIISPPKEKLEGKTIYEVTDSAIIRDREERYKSVLEGHSQLEQFDENDRSLLTNALPIKDDMGNIIYGMVIILDITDLKHAQKELEEKASNLKRSNEELERFAYVASHDLQGPLRTITSYLQLLEQRYFADLGQDAKDFISFSVSGAKRMQQLITDLLNYSRLNSVPRPYQNVNLNDLVFVVTKGLESTIQAKEATIEYHGLPTIFAEQYQLTQMMQNLIDNGMKFVKDRKPHIKIVCTEDNDYWKLSVSDNGIGIQNDFKEKVFMIFQRLHTETEYPGTGIGLAICKKVADLHDGRIWFESEYGHGTTFFVTISKHLKNKND